MHWWEWNGLETVEWSLILWRVCPLHMSRDSHTEVLVSVPWTLHPPSPFAEVVFLLHRQNLLALHLPQHCYTLKSKSDEWLFMLAMTHGKKKKTVMNCVSMHGCPCSALYQISWTSSQVKPSSMGKEESPSTRSASDSDWIIEIMENTPEPP